MFPSCSSDMYATVFSTAYSSVRHHEQLPRHLMIYQHNLSAAQTLAGLQEEVRHLKRSEHAYLSQIHELQSYLEDVQAILYAKINRANELQNLLAPISRLPNEMLLTIFDEVVADQDLGEEQRAEFTLSKVSRRWRELAIHSPRLWRRVCITPRIAPGMLEVYKARGSRVLDVEICGWKDRRDFQRFDTALETMLDTSSRWRSLSIAGLCDTHLSHLTLKLSHIGPSSGLKHFKFRALRPGQTCSVSFLTEMTTAAQPHSRSQAPSTCALRSLDAENFVLTGDPGDIYARATQSFTRLSSLTLRRYHNDSRSLRIMIDFSAFRAMLSAIPHLTTLVLHGQPLRFRTDPVGGGLQGQDDSHGIAIGNGGGTGASTNPSTILLPQLHTLVLHPRVLKPRYLQHTISAIHAPALRHFELVFPHSKMSGQNIVERLFIEASPSSSSHPPSYTSYPSSTSSTEQCRSKRRPRFPRVETLVLHNASNAGAAQAFVQAFPCTTHVTLGGVDIGFFPLVLRGCVGPCVEIAGAATDVGIGPAKVAESGSKSRVLGGSGSISGTVPCDCTRFAYWHWLRTLTLRQPRKETLRVLLDWLHDENEQGHVTPMLIIEGSLDSQDIRFFAQCAGRHTRVELVGTQVPSPIG